jgi:hypothetical protein
LKYKEQAREEERQKTENIREYISEEGTEKRKYKNVFFIWIFWCIEYRPKLK